MPKKAEMRGMAVIVPAGYDTAGYGRGLRELKLVALSQQIRCGAA